MNFDFRFFEDSLHRLRKLRFRGYDASPMLEAPRQLFPDLDLGMAPRLLSEIGGSTVISETEGSPSERVILTRSYARQPGRSVGQLEKALQNGLPRDYRQFLEAYDEALITTRTYPIHLWSVDQIIREIAIWRDNDAFPLRFFRLGQYWDIYGLYFGLWQTMPSGSDWSVVIATHSNRDDDLDLSVESESILAPSFHAWLKTLIETDGLPDPYKEIGPEGGFLDPV